MYRNLWRYESIAGQEVPKIEFACRNLAAFLGPCFSGLECRIRKSKRIIFVERFDLDPIILRNLQLEYEDERMAAFLEFRVGD